MPAPLSLHGGDPAPGTSEASSLHRRVIHPALSLAVVAGETLDVRTKENGFRVYCGVFGAGSGCGPGKSGWGEEIVTKLEFVVPNFFQWFRASAGFLMFAPVVYIRVSE